MSEQEMKAEVGKYIVATKGVFAEDKVAEEITKLAALCPQSSAEDKNLTTDLEKAYYVINTMNGGQESAPPAVNPTQTNPVVTQPTTGISAAQQSAISKQLIAEKAQRDAISANTKLDKYVLDKPDPAEIIPAGTKALIRPDSWENFMKKISEGKYTVCPDDGADVDEARRIPSTTNFNLLKAAAEAKTPVDVYIGKLVTKPIGYIVNKGTVTGTEQVTVQMQREKLRDFVTIQGAGYVLSQPGKPGVKLRYVNPTQDPDNPGKQRAGHTVLTDCNKKDAIACHSYVVSQEVTPEVERTTVKTALSMRVVESGKFRKDGVTPLTKTIRISCSAELPVLQRKKEFLEEFGDPKATNAELMTVPTGDQAAKIFQAQREQVAALMAKAANPDTMYQVADMAEGLQKFAAPAAPAPAMAM